MGAITSGRKGEILLQGYIGLNSWTWTAGDDLYASTVAGELTNVAPVAPDIIQIIANVVEPTLIYFNSDLGSGGGSGECAILEGHTAYVGSNACREPHTNYWLVDGVADDVQINAALTYVSGLGGGSVFLERGVYDITDPVTFPGNNIMLCGIGRDSFLDGDNLATTEHCIVINGYDDITIKDIGIQTQNGGTKTCHGIYMTDCYRTRIIDVIIVNSDDNGIYVDAGSQRFLIKNVNILDADGHGIILSGAASIGVGHIVNCVIEGCGGHGILSGTNSSDHVFIGNNFGGNGLSGMCFSSSSSNIVANNQTWNNGNDGITLYQSYKNIVIGSHCKNNTWSGITCNLSDDNNIEDNQCLENLQHGINIYDSDNNIVTGNECIDNDYEDTNSYDGIRIESNCLDNLIDNNYLNGNDRYGIYIGDAGSTRTQVLNNKYVDNTSGCISDSGTDTATPETFLEVTDPDDTLGTHPVLVLTDGITVNAYSQLAVPMGYHELVSASVIISAGGAGDLRRSVNTNWGKMCSTEDYNAQTDSIAAGVVAVLATDLTCIDISTAFTSIAPGDLIGVQFTRIGGDASDTVNADCYYMGIRVRYV